MGDGLNTTRWPDGFTLLEMLVVLVIIGMLAAFVAPRYLRQIDRSKATIARDQVESFDRALVQYRIDTGHYPKTAGGLPALFAPPADEPLWHGPYLHKRFTADPWGNAYVYRNPGTDGREFDVLSFGADGQAGGAGDDADIGNWTRTE